MLFLNFLRHPLRSPNFWLESVPSGTSHQYSLMQTERDSRQWPLLTIRTFIRSWYVNPVSNLGVIRKYLLLACDTQWFGSAYCPALSLHVVSTSWLNTVLSACWSIPYLSVTSKQWKGRLTWLISSTSENGTLAISDRAIKYMMVEYDRSFSSVPHTIVLKREDIHHQTAYVPSKLA